VRHEGTFSTLVFGYFKLQRLRTGKLLVKCMLFNNYLIYLSKEYLFAHAFKYLYHVRLITY
jgi:hypothetical protein